MRQKVEVARVFLPLLAHVRYKGLHGGRGGAKSHFFGEQIITQGHDRPLRIVCIREVQNSIRDSVRQLLVDKIQKFGLGNWYTVLDSEIRGPNGTNIVFRGMQSYNAETIKSLENYDIAWVEEAQTLSAKSLQLLRPTIRAPGSELWFSWNPRFRTDAVDEFLRKSPPADSVVIPVNYNDNPWFPDVLEKERLHDKATNPDEYEHIWEGGYGVPKGSILGKQVETAEREGRVGDHVEFDPDATAIEVSSDIGFRDTATWWFWQRKLGGYSLIHYVGGSGQDAQLWIEELKGIFAENEWPLGKIWLPHDARAKTFQTRHSAVEQFAKAFGVSKVDIVPQSKKADRVNAARTVIQQCEFAETACEDGLNGLRAWQYEWNDDTKAFSRDPKHDWASHPSDGFSYGCQVMQFAPPPEADAPPVKWPHQQTAAEVFNLDEIPETEDYV